jgi:hypothetical protein
VEKLVLVARSIFVSHSKHDKEVIDHIRAAFVRVGIAGTFIEVEKVDTKYAGEEISKIIRNDCDAVVVLLGKNLQNPPTSTPEYTHNWVSFEAGVAAGCQKPVWVLEDYDDNIRFPVPYVSDYVRIELGNAEDIRRIGGITNDYFGTKERNLSPNDRVSCPHKNCNAVYNYWGLPVELNCPVCRQHIYRNSFK